MTARVVRYRTDHGVFTAVVGEPGRKLMPVVYIDNPVRLVKVPMDEVRYMIDIEYPVKKACRKMLAAGKNLGITKPARRFLKAPNGEGS